jgi:hypothetical protein
MGYQHGAVIHLDPESAVCAPLSNLTRNKLTSRRGKTRLAKWYAPYNDEEKIKLKGEVSPPAPPPLCESS